MRKLTKQQKAGKIAYQFLLQCEDKKPFLYKQEMGKIKNFIAKNIDDLYLMLIYVETDGPYYGMCLSEFIHSYKAWSESRQFKNSTPPVDSLAGLNLYSALQKLE